MARSVEGNVAAFQMCPYVEVRESKWSRDCDEKRNFFSAGETDGVTRVDGELILTINWRWKVHIVNLSYIF